MVRLVPRFWRDVACLLELTELHKPPKQLYRAKHVMAFFIIGDAYGSGKGVRGGGGGTVWCGIQGRGLEDAVEERVVQR